MTAPILEMHHGIAVVHAGVVDAGVVLVLVFDPACAFSDDQADHFFALGKSKQDRFAAIA